MLGSPMARPQTWINFRLGGGNRGEEGRSIVVGIRASGKRNTLPAVPFVPKKKHAAVGCACGTGSGWPESLQPPAIATVLCSSLCPAWPCFGTSAVPAPSGPSPRRCGRTTALNAAIVSPAAAWLCRGRGPSSPAFQVSCNDAAGRKAAVGDSQDKPTMPSPASPEPRCSCHTILPRRSALQVIEGPGPPCSFTQPLQSPWLCFAVDVLHPPAINHKPFDFCKKISIYCWK